MKYLLLFAPFLSACDRRADEVRIPGHHGQLAAIVHWADGQKDGPFTLYWPDGTARANGSYREDRPEGWWQSFHPNGNRRSLTHYAAGKKDGKRIYWDSTGMTLRSETFRNGMRNGTFYRFYPDGRPAQRTGHMNDQLDGVHEQWYDEQGGSHLLGHYKQGRETGLWTERDTLGKLIWQAELLNGQVVGTITGKRRRH